MGLRPQFARPALGACLLIGLLGAALGPAGLPMRVAAAATCGGMNQRPCRVWERVPSCDKGAVEDFVRDRCVKPGAAAPIVPIPNAARDRAVVAAMAGHLDVLRPVAACLVSGARKDRFTNAVLGRDALLAERAVRECASDATIAAISTVPTALRPHAPNAPAPGCTGAAAARRPKMWTIGILGPGAQLAIGGGVEVGVAIRLNGCGSHPVRFYETHGWKLGVGIGAGIDVVPMAVSFSPVAPGYTESFGRTYAGKAGLGATVGVWYDNDTNAWDGTSVAFGVGAGLDAGSLNRTGTTIF